MQPFLNILAELANADRPSVGLSLRDEWEYEGTGIAAVGARAMTLGERINPLMISRPGEEPVAVLLPVDEVVGDSRLEWILQAGTELDGDEGQMLQVPFALWQEHADEIVGPRLPERDGEGIERSLAVAEREFRFAQQSLDASRMVRNCLVVLASVLGRSRREVGETLGLSLGRVQQLNEDPPPEVINAVEELVEAATLVAKNIGKGTCPRQEVPKPRHLTHEQLSQVIDAMLGLGLLEEDAAGVRLTIDGAALDDVAGSVARRKRKSAERMRAGDATK